MTLVVTGTLAQLSPASEAEALIVQERRQGQRLGLPENGLCS